MKSPEWIAFDLEDNGPELMARGESGTLRKVTTIAAVDSTGASYFSEGNVPEFLSWLLARRGATCWAHNCSYDLGLLFGDRLEEVDFQFPTGNSSRMTRANWNGIRFCDSLNLITDSLEGIGQALGIRKLPLDPRSRDYVERDVQIVAAVLERVYRFAARNGIEVGATVGRMAVRLFQKWEGNKIRTDHFFLAQESYYGGRVEIFSTGSSAPCVWQDVNSLYPWAMTGTFPSEAPELGIGHDQAEHGFCAAEVELPETWLATLPVREPEGRIIYPTGTFRGVWTFLELRAAIARGAKVRKVFSSYGSRKVCRPFKSWADRVHTLKREASNPADRIFYKALLNSLGGQLASTGSCWRTVKKGAGIAVAPMIGNRVLSKVDFPLEDHVNFPWAAILTSRARVRLLEALEKVGERDLIYCDTDSAIYECPSRKPVLGNSKGLGAWRVEGWADRVVVRAPKVYRFGDRVRAKGVRRSAAEEFVDTGAATFDLPYTFRESVLMYGDGNSRKMSSWRKVKKSAATTYSAKAARGCRWVPHKVDLPIYYPRKSLHSGVILGIFGE